jgi:hypothetical protein
MAGVTVRRKDEQSAGAVREGKALAKVILDRKAAAEREFRAMFNYQSSEAVIRVASRKSNVSYTQKSENREAHADSPARYNHKEKGPWLLMEFELYNKGESTKMISFFLALGRSFIQMHIEIRRRQKWTCAIAPRTALSFATC